MGGLTGALVVGLGAGVGAGGLPKLEAPPPYKNVSTTNEVLSLSQIQHREQSNKTNKTCNNRRQRLTTNACRLTIRPAGLGGDAGRKLGAGAFGLGGIFFGTDDGWTTQQRSQNGRTTHPHHMRTTHSQQQS